MNIDSAVNKKAIHTISCVDGLLFWIFCTVYLAIFQGEMLTMMMKVYFPDRLLYNPWAGALLITAVLNLVQWGICRLFFFSKKLMALSYIPSFLLLSAFTNVNNTFYQGYSLSVLSLLSLGLIAVFLFVMKMREEIVYSQRESKGSLLKFININLLLMSLLCLFSVSMANTDENFHHELSVEVAISNADYERAMNIGRQSLTTSRELTALRALALSRANQLGERFFEYPQLFGIEGLLLSNQAARTTFFTSDSLQIYLGGSREQHENVIDYLYRISTQPEAYLSSKEYYRIALLLDKKLSDFYQSISNDSVDINLRPKHFAEALTLYRHLHPELLLASMNEDMETRFAAFLQLQSEYASPLEQENRIRREYGNTYWYYYYYFASNHFSANGGHCNPAPERIP
ncbi:MAG: DUF6057 family protein [Bacteroidaceae bacterium]